MRWFGHIMIILKWVPRGKKKKGRPRRSWNEGSKDTKQRRQMDKEMAQGK